MADEKGAALDEFTRYRNKRLEEGSIESALDRRRQKKRPGPFRHEHALPPQEAYELVLEKIAGNDYRIDEGLERFFKSQGYWVYAKHEDRLIYAKGREDDMVCIMNRNFLTDELSLCAIVINDFEEEILDRRLFNNTYGSVARLRNGHHTSRASEIIPKIMIGAGLIATAFTYAVSDLESAAFMAVISMGLPTVAYAIANVANKNANKGILPYKIAKRQVIAADDPQKFFEVAFGIEDLVQPKSSA